MRKSLLSLALAMGGLLAITGCSQHDQSSDQSSDQTPAAAAQPAVTKPTDVNDAAGWNKYLAYLVSQHLDGMTAAQPFAYLVTPGDSDEAKAARDRQLQTVQDTVSRGVIPGQLLAFGGSQSAQTADLVIAAFKDAKPGSFKGVIVVFIGDETDRQRVTDALQPTGATLRYVVM
ncbi:hypothetical protein ACYJW8_06895 [Frateuria aurantia]